MDTIESKFVIGCLKSKLQLEKWLDFLESAFREKGTPRSYFEAHVKNDPYFDLSQVWTVEKNNEILSTLRIFDRRVYIDEQEVSMCGVGEVSTRPDERGKGLASMLLCHVMDELRESKRYSIGCLHSSREHLQQYYGRRGWCQVPVHYADFRVMVDVEKLKQQDNSNVADTGRTIAVSPVDWSKDEEVYALSKLYVSAMVSHDGALVRRGDTDQGLAYWRNWVGTASGLGCCLVRSKLSSQPLGYCLSKLEHNSQSDEGKITLLEICMDSEAVRSCVSTDRGQLLATCLWSCLTAAQTSSDKPMQTVSLNVPVGMVDTDSVREAMRQLQISVESVSSRMDAGFMFMLLESSTLPQSAQQRLQEHSERECGEDQPKPEQMLFSSAPTFSRLDLF